MKEISERDADLNAYFQSPVFGSAVPLRTKDPIKVGPLEIEALARIERVKTAFRATGRVGAFVPGSSFTPEEETAIREERKAYRQAVARSLETTAERKARERDEATAREWAEDAGFRAATKAVADEEAAKRRAEVEARLAAPVPRYVRPTDAEVNAEMKANAAHHAARREVEAQAKAQRAAETRESLARQFLSDRKAGKWGIRRPTGEVGEIVARLEAESNG